MNWIKSSTFKRGLLIELFPGAITEINIKLIFDLTYEDLKLSTYTSLFYLVIYRRFIQIETLFFI